MAGRDDNGDRLGVGSQPTLPASDPRDALASADTIAGDSNGSSAAGERRLPERGDLIDRYSVVEVLGQGGMGVVVAAYDADLDRRIAIKLLRSDAYEGEAADDAKARLLREAQAMAKLSHPNVVPVYDVGTVDDQVFIAMEYADGGTLRDWVTDSKPGWRDTLERYMSAGQGLAAAHRAGLVHRDFKPDNVLAHADGRVQVGDFGLVGTSSSRWKPKQTDDVAASPSLDVTLTRAGAVMGTPAYMAPEQFAGEDLEAHADQFAFCVSLYEALYGQRPFSGRTYAELQSAVVLSKVEPAPDDTTVPPRMRTVLLRGLASDPAARYQSMEALLAALEAAGRNRRRQYGLAAVVGLVAIALAVGAVVATRGGSKTTKPAPTAPDRPRAYAEAKQLTFRGDVKHALMNPTGTLMAYVSGRELRVRSVADKTEKVIQSAPIIKSLSWSADGAQLFYIVRSRTSSAGVHAYSAATGDDRRVAPAAGSVCALPGDRIAVSYGSRKTIKIYDLNAGTSTSVPVGGTYTWLAKIDFAIASGRFLIQTKTAGRGRIWTMKRDGSDRQLVVEGELLGQSRWAPSGDAIYYLAPVGRQSGNVMRVAVDKATGRAVGKPRVVVREVAQDTWFTHNSFSVGNDGAITYVRGQSHNNLWLVTRSDSGAVTKRRITRGSASKLGVQVSPDGKMLAYATTTPSGAHLVVRTTQPSGQPRVLAKLRESTPGLAWSPDGSQLAFITVDAKRQLGLYRVAVAGGEPQRLDVPRPGSQRSISWAPAEHIAYQLPGNKNFNLVEPKTSRATPLMTKLNGWYFAPEFSPDATKVAVFWNRTPRGLWLIDMKTRKASALNKAEALPIGWSKDNKWVYAFANEWSAKAQVLRVSVANGESQPWLDLTEYAVTPRRVELVDDGNSFVLSVVEGSTDAWVSRAE